MAIKKGAPAGPTGARGLLPAAGFVTLLTLGQMPVAPVARAWVSHLAEDGRLGLYTGALFGMGLPAVVSWLVLGVVPAAAVGLLPRRVGALP